MSEIKCAYKGLGCGKEDTCARSGRQVLDCNIRPYLVFLDTFGPDAEMDEAPGS